MRCNAPVSDEKEGRGTCVCQHSPQKSLAFSEHLAFVTQYFSFYSKYHKIKIIDSQNGFRDINYFLACFQTYYNSLLSPDVVNVVILRSWYAVPLSIFIKLHLHDCITLIFKMSSFIS